VEIVKERAGDFLHVRVSGRLDNHWSEPFEDAIEEMIREGAHHLRLDLSEVNYLSSAGVGVLMQAYRDTQSLHGSFLISAASERVRTVLRLVELESLLFGSPVTDAPPPPATSSGVPRELRSENALFDCYPLDAARSECSFIGEPARLTQGAYEAANATSIRAGNDLFAVGVGALGESYDECRGLFGEFLAAAGLAAYMPTDGTSTPDYMTRSGELVPEIQALYAIVFRGSPGHLLRFEASSPGGGVVLSEIVAACAEVAGTPDFGIVMAAEVSGLVCTMLRRSPAMGEAAQFDFPAVRDWLSFAPERAYARTSSLVVGVASSSPSETARPFLRPLSDEHEGHFHAAVTAFRALPRGKVEMAAMLAQAFQPRSVVSIVHLLRDNRPIEGAGESEFLRGACWLFPMSIERGAAS
jgi:anti-sigma B factor antagonist